MVYKYIWNKDRIIILFELCSAKLCDSNGILNVKIDQVEQKLATNTIIIIIIIIIILFTSKLESILKTIHTILEYKIHTHISIIKSKIHGDTWRTLSNSYFHYKIWET